MTDTAKRPTWIRTTAVVALIALFIGVAGGWVLYYFAAPPTPSAVWLLRADQATLVQGDDAAVLTLTGVGQQVASYDTGTDSITSLTPAADFFGGWDATFGDDAQRAALTGIAGGEQVEFSAELADAVWDEASNSVTFRVEDFEGTGQLERVLEVVVAIEGS